MDGGALGHFGVDLAVGRLGSSEETGHQKQGVSTPTYTSPISIS